MRRLLVLVSLFSMPLLANDLPSGLAQEVAQELDNICGDSWCEGDFDWSFNDLTCDFKSGECKIELTLFESPYPDFEDARDQQERRDLVNEMTTYPGIDFDGDHYEKGGLSMTETCTMTGFKKLSDVAEGYSYSQKLYDDVSECISDMEDRFYRQEEKAGILSKIKSCAEVEFLDVFQDYSDDEYRSRRFYNEEAAWGDLMDYTTSQRPGVEVYQTFLENLYIGHNNPRARECSDRMNSIYRSYHVLGLSIGRDWNPIKTKAFIFTKKIGRRKRQSIKVLLKNVLNY